MNRLFKFVKWWWNNNDAVSRALAVTISWLFISLLTIPFFGVGSLGVFLFGLIGALIGTLLYQLGKNIWSEWKTFSRENPPDDVRIMNRLRGDDPNRGWNDQW